MQLNFFVCKRMPKSYTIYTIPAMPPVTPAGSKGTLQLSHTQAIQAGWISGRVSSRYLTSIWLAINTNGDQVSSSQILLSMYSADAKLDLNAVGSCKNAALHISEVEKSPADTMISGGQVGYKAQPWKFSSLTWSSSSLWVKSDIVSIATHHRHLMYLNCFVWHLV